MTTKLNHQKAASRNLRRVVRDQRALLVRLKKSVDESCGKCDYDEAEGGLVNHCPECCHRITTMAWAVTHPQSCP